MDISLAMHRHSKQHSPDRRPPSTLAVAVISNHFSEVISALARHSNLKLIIGVNAPQMPEPGIKRLLWRCLRWWQGNTSLEDWAQRHNISYLAYAKDQQQAFARHLVHNNIDVLVSFSGPFLGQALIDAPKRAAVNIHPSELPAYRGGNPLLWQVVDGVEQSAVTIHRLCDQLDRGDILTQTPYILLPGRSRFQLVRRMEHVAAQAIVDLIRMMETERLPTPRQQPAHSPTPNAFNRTRDQLGSLIPWHEATSDQLFRVVGYLGHWPHEIEKPVGWRSLFSYRARRPLPPNPSRSCGLSPNGLGMVYQSQNGALELTPEVSPLALIRHFRQLRRLERGQLREQPL